LAGTIVEKELRWKARMGGFVKVNWDAAIETTKKKMGIGIIILATLSEHKDNIIAHEIVEAMAALRVVNFNRELGFYKVIVEGDAFKIMQAPRKEGSSTFMAI
jgi:hypothetical protein